MTDPAGRAWVADPRIGWRILLTARLTPAPDPESVAERLTTLCRRQDWGAAPALARDDDVRRLQARLTSARPEPVMVGLAGGDLVLSARHSHVDGQGLLSVLSALTGHAFASSARGVGDRPADGGLARAVGRRLVEVAVRPPARVDPAEPPPEQVPPDPPDVLVERTLAGRWSTADLVHAAAQGIADHLRSTGQPSRRIAVAVGVAGALPEEHTAARIADRSALIRLRDVETLGRDQIAHLLRTAPVATPPSGRGGLGRALAPVVRTGLRMLAPRLGSTVLVSHLGEVASPPGLERLAFHPVTAGGSGLSLGAVTVALPTGDGTGTRTVLTLRARSDRWRADGLERLLEAIGRRL